MSSAFPNLFLMIFSFVFFQHICCKQAEATLFLPLFRVFSVRFEAFQKHFFNWYFLVSSVMSFPFCSWILKNSLKVTCLCLHCCSFLMPPPFLTFCMLVHLMPWVCALCPLFSHIRVCLLSQNFQSSHLLVQWLSSLQWHYIIPLF